MSNVNMTELTISWTEVNSICPDSITYNVTSNCIGVTCITISNEATCSNLPIASMCTFSIDSEVCGQSETVNSAISVILRRMFSCSHILYSHATYIIIYNLYRSTSEHNTCLLCWRAFNINKNDDYHLSRGRSTIHPIYCITVYTHVAAIIQHSRWCVHPSY